MADRPNYVLRALERFTDYGDADAIVWAGRDYRCSYAQARATVLDFAARLRDAGYRPGMTVAVVVAHPPEAPLLGFALHLLGCRTAWIDSDAPRGEIDQYMAAVAPDRFVYDTRSRHAPLGAALAEQLGVPVTCLGPDGPGPDLLAEPDTRPQPFDLATATGEPESIFQTSGTTGTPKLIHHGAGLYDEMFAIAEDWVAGGQPHLRHLSLTPMWHAAGQATILLNLFTGGELILMFGWDASDYLATVERYRATSVYISPLMVGALLDEPAFATTDLSSLRLVSVGGAAISPARLSQAIEAFGPIVRMTYGLSELPYISDYPAMAYDPAHPDRLRSVGPPHGDVRVQLRDEQGNEVAAGEVGEIWATSRLLFTGYWGRPDLTEQTLVDGWLRTSDLAYQDEDGYLHLVGRAQDMIITGIGGEHIFPRPIEEVLAAQPGVRTVAVFGVPHDELGEAAHACVVAQGRLDPDELGAAVRAALGPVWVPREIEFVDELPRTRSGKVDVRALKASWAAAHSAVPAAASPAVAVPSAEPIGASG